MEHIAIILGAILGVVLLLIGAIGWLSQRRKGKVRQWVLWISLAGVCALITAGINALRFL